MDRGPDGEIELDGTLRKAKGQRHAAARDLQAAITITRPLASFDYILPTVFSGSPCHPSHPYIYNILVQCLGTSLLSVLFSEVVSEPRDVSKIPKDLDVIFFTPRTILMKTIQYGFKTFKLNPRVSPFYTLAVRGRSSLKRFVPPTYACIGRARFCRSKQQVIHHGKASTI